MFLFRNYFPFFRLTDDESPVIASDAGKGAPSPVSSQSDEGDAKISSKEIKNILSREGKRNKLFNLNGLDVDDSLVTLADINTGRFQPSNYHKVRIILL